MFGALANLFGGAVHGLANGISKVFHQPQPAKPAAAPPARPAPSLGQFLATHLQPAANAAVRAAPGIVKSINGNPIVHAVGNAVNQGVIQPINRGQQALYKAETGQKVDLRQLAADTVTTGTNFAGGGLAKGLLKGGSLGAKLLRGALEGGAIGGTQGAAQTFADKGATGDYAKNIALGGALGAAGGVAVPAAGAAVRAGAKGLKLALKDTHVPVAAPGAHVDVPAAISEPTRPGVPAPAPSIKTASPATGSIPAKLPVAPTKLAAPDVNAALSTAVGKTTRYAGKTVPESDLVSEPIRTQVKAEAPTYDVQTEKAGLQNSADLINRLGPDGAIEDVQHRLNVPDGKIDRQTVIDAQSVAAGLDARGDMASHRQATDIYKQLSSHLTASGQAIQAAAMLARRTPEGLKYSAVSDLRKGGVDITPELESKINAHIDEIRGAPDQATKNRAVAKLSKTVVKELPKSAGSNIIGVWKAGLLSGAKTQGGNFVSNATFGALKKISDAPAALVDQGLGLITNKRTKTFSLKGASGFGEGVKKGIDTLKTGIDERDIGADGKYEQPSEINFKNPVIQKVFGDPSNLVFRAMGAADQPFYYASFKNNLYDIAKADGLTKGLEGDALKAHVEASVKDPSSDLAQIAKNAADYAVLGQKSHVASWLNKAPSSIKPGVQILAPFIKVPTNFISETLDYTPVGAIKQITKQIFKGVKSKGESGFDQRALSEAIGKAGTGTAVIYLGSQLAQGGLLSGDYPSNDPKEAARWKAEGITPNSVKVGNKWISLNYLGPVGLLFNAGKKLVDAGTAGGHAAAQAAAAIAGLGQGLLGQSFLQGFSGFNDAITDPERSAGTFVNSELSSIVPSWLNDLGNLSDPTQRQANNAGQAAEARLPGLRTNLNPKVDSLGNELTQPSGPGFGGSLNAALNPLKPSEQINSSMYDEVNRLHAAGQDVFPVAAKTIGSGPDTVKLNGDQQLQRAQMVGDQLTPIWDKIIADPGYANLDDAHKHDVLQAALTDVNSVVDRTLMSQIDPSKLTTAAKGDTAKILSGHGPTAGDYVEKTTASQSGTPTTPAEKYQADLAKYQTDKAGGKLSGTQDFKTQTSLAKEKITSQYSQDVLDFYGMSKEQEKAYYDSDPTGAQKLYNAAVQLDKQLGGTKYKNGLTVKASGSGSKVKIPKLTAAKSVKVPSIHAFKAPKQTKLKLPKAPRVKVSSGKKVKLTLV